jgi:hypothetical protein
MSQKSAKSAAELESMIMAELREHPECESAGVAVTRPISVAWDADEDLVWLGGRDFVAERK